MRYLQTGAMTIYHDGFIIDYGVVGLPALTAKDMAILAITRQPWFW